MILQLQFLRAAEHVIFQLQILRATELVILPLQFLRASERGWLDYISLSSIAHRLVLIAAFAL